MIKKFIRSYYERYPLFNYKEFALEDKLSVIFTITGLVLTVIAFVVSLVFGMPFRLNVVNLILLMILLFLPYFLSDNIRLATLCMLYIVGYLYFPFVFFTNGGNDGSITIYFVLIVVYIAFYFKGLRLQLTIASLLTIYLSIMILTYINPDLVLPYDTGLSKFVDLSIAVVGVSIITSIVASNTFERYRESREEIMKLNYELEKRNDQLELLSYTDQLTEVYNRRHFLDVLENELEHFKKYKQHFNLLMIDIDDFKDINDTRGHLFGDEVLRKIAQCVKSCIRDYDIVARYGGEEFAVIISHLNPEDALLVAERIRRQVENLELRDNIKVTVSIGVTKNEVNDRADDIIARADLKLYDSKASGKNKVT